MNMEITAWDLLYILGLVMPGLACGFGALYQARALWRGRRNWGKNLGTDR